MIGYLAVYLLGIVTLPVFNTFILPKIRKWLKIKVKEWENKKNEPPAL